MKWTNSLKDSIYQNAQKEEVDNLNRPESITEIELINNE